MKHVFILMHGDYGDCGYIEGIFKLKKDAVDYIREIDAKYAYRDNRIYECDELCKWFRIDKRKVL